MYNLIYYINETPAIVDAWEPGLKQTYQEKLHNKNFMILTLYDTLLP